jgi:hypothetical protein
VYDDAHRDAYGPGDFVYATPHEVRGMLTRGGRRSLADVAKTIFALEHHAWFLVRAARVCVCKERQRPGFRGGGRFLLFGPDSQN